MSSEAKFIVAESVGNALWVFQHGFTQNGYVQTFSNEPDAIKHAAARSQRENRQFLVMKIVATVVAEELLPPVRMDR